jgi:DNA end-binding protein Ku
VLEPETLKSAAEKEVAPKELEMAKALIETMTTEWEPTKYKDQYQTAVMEMIEEKAQNKSSSSMPKASRIKSNVVDLVAVLQESLRKQSAKPKAMRRSTSTLLKQKKRAA